MEKSSDSAYDELKSWSSSLLHKDNFYVKTIKELLLNLDNMGESSILEYQEINDIITNYYACLPHPSTIRDFLKYIDDDLKEVELKVLSKYEKALSDLENEHQQLQKEAKIEQEIENFNKQKKSIESKKTKKIQDTVIKNLKNIESIEQKITQFLQCLDENLQENIQKFRQLLTALKSYIL